MCSWDMIVFFQKNGHARERGSFMIEIIREENLNDEQEKIVVSQGELPKNIKQIGSPDIGDRIYIENKVHQYLHPFDAGSEKTVYVLLGKFENHMGRPCVFVQAAICIEEILFEGDVPVWNDDSWAYLYKKLKHTYDEMVITGWALDIRGSLPELTDAVEKLHRTYFGGEHQVLYLLDSLEREDYFFSFKNGVVKKREGYYIYYEKKLFGAVPPEPVQFLNLHAEEKKENKENDEQTQTQPQEKQTAKKTGGAYRTYLQQKQKKKIIISPAYSLSAVLFFAVCGLSYAAYWNHAQMSAMETALMQIGSVQTEQIEESAAVEVEMVEGMLASDFQAEQTADEPVQTENNEMMQTADAQQEQEIQPQEIVVSEVIPQEETQQSESAQAVVSENVLGQTQTMGQTNEYLAQGYYIVQKGDNLAGICRRIYQNTQMLQKVCEVNGIDNPDAIYEGQYLSLPN